MIWAGRIFLAWMVICTTFLMYWVISIEIQDRRRERRAHKARDEYYRRDAA